MKDEYINAILQMLKDGQDLEVILAGLKKTLEKRGHQELHKSILAGVLRVIEARSIDESVVTVATVEAYKQQEEAIKQALTKINANDKPKVKIDATIIGGFVAEANNTRFDQSYKTKLVNLYRSLTN